MSTADLSPAGALRLLDDADHVDLSTVTRGTEILESISGGSTCSYLRVYSPAQVVAFTRRDRHSAGYAAAVDAARSRGFAAVTRDPGGRASAYHRGSLCVEFISTDPMPREGIDARYRALEQLLIRTFADLGISAHGGSVPGEYCPGSNSIATTRGKLVGTAQRLVGRGWFIGAGIHVTDPEPIRRVLTDVYRHLDLEFRPDSVSCVADHDPSLTVTDVREALLANVHERVTLLGAPGYRRSPAQQKGRVA